ncbi:MAG: hypothetical protein QOF51_260, partial [Chloroflexota bacterium]|nr:hypothetical protein [Chloroflexota bacterium]
MDVWGQRVNPIAIGQTSPVGTDQEIGGEDGRCDDDDPSKEHPGHSPQQPSTAVAADHRTHEHHWPFMGEPTTRAIGATMHVRVPEGPRRRIRPALHRSMLGIIIAGGAILRAWFVLRDDFPLNDGGLSFAMIEALGTSHLRLPETVIYDGASIPYAYPPLAFYAARMLADVSGIPVLDTLRFIPLIASVLGLVAFAFFAHTVLRDSVAEIVAVALIACMPISFIWLIMGGGLTRAFGYAFGLLALREAYVISTSRSELAPIRFAALFTLTLLSHIEMAWYVAVSVALLLIAYGRTRAALARTLAAVGGAMLLAAPWWAVVVAHHGLGPFVAAAQAGSPFVQADAGSGAFLLFPILMGICCLALAATGDRRLVLLGWIGTIWLLDVRAFAWMMTIPIALGVGAAAAGLVRRFTDPQSLSGGEAVLLASMNASTERLLNAAALAAVVGLLALTTQSSLGVVSAPIALSADDRAAMQWIASDAPPGSRFLVLTGDAWATDRVEEWFPVLTQHTSVTTPQGTEWLPGRAFHERVVEDTAIQRCAASGADCSTSASSP